MQLAHSIGFMVREPKRKPETLPEFDRHQYEEYRRYLFERELAEQTQIQRYGGFKCEVQQLMKFSF